MSDRVRRKLGKVLSDPIDELKKDKYLDTMILVENDEKAASRTRAAACMYILRNDYDFTTSVRGKEVWICKDKDNIGSSKTIDISRLEQVS